MAEEKKEKRKSRCTHCHEEVESHPGLPFFTECSDDEMDRFYCGCYGWD